MTRAACRADNCDNQARVKGLCPKHYARLRRHGDINHERPRQVPVCTIDGCERSTEALGLCKMHYQRKWEGREIGGAEPIKMRGRGCSIDGCDKPHDSMGFCIKHRERHKKYGDPLVTRWVPGGDEIGYTAAHGRVRRAKGAPSEYDCEHCGATAQDWAYDHADPDERIVATRGKFLPISLTPDHYIPLCRTCHRNFDLSH